jgi:dihydropteroate synthase
MADGKMKELKLGVTHCGRSMFRWGERTYIMGIINLSPDSFSGDGLCDVKAAMAQAEKMVEEGADIIDVGGESTRPDSASISEEEEIRRIVPFIKEAAKALGVPVSVDTYKMEVARWALHEGACMINDISGLSVAPDLVVLAAQRNVPIILMSNERGRPASNIMESVTGNLRHLIGVALAAGVKQENVIIDPGIGFGKTVAQNLELLRRLDELSVLGRPILLGTSRKSFIGKVLGVEVTDRLEGTAATVAIGISKGADIVRVHDVKEMRLISRMSDAIARGISGDA